MVDQKQKRIKDYKETRSAELELFQEIPLGDGRVKYSNLIKLYDLVPKYCDYVIKCAPNTFLKTIKRQFTYDRNEYEVSLQPARVETKEGEQERFPGKREELIEDALRKIAMDSENCMFYDGMVGIKFTLRQLKKELKNVGCSASLDEIKQSLEICARTIMKIKTTNGNSQFSITSPLFRTLILIDRIQFENGEKYCFVQFHPLVTQAVTQKAFKLYDYSLGMTFKSILSSYLYKRMCYKFTYAEKEL